VFITHGTQDDNVRFNQATIWWDALKARGVPRKMWITRTGHEDPFDFRRAHWVDTLHRWFDHELQGLQNGIMDEPKVDVEIAKDVFETASDWPVPGSELTDVFLQGIAPGSAGAFGLSSGGATDSLAWTDANFNNEGAIINAPLGQQTSRRVFLSPKLKTDLRISGTPVIDIEASVNGTQTNLGAALVEYGPTTQVSRSGDGIANVPPPDNEDCWGESSPTDDACYVKVFKPESTQNVWRVTKGILDTSNRESLLATAATPITIDQKYRFRWPTFPHDYVFKAGNQIGLVLIADYTQFNSVAGTGQGRTVTLDTKTSKMQLPIVGGATAAAASGAFVADTEAPVFNHTVLEVSSTSAGGRTVDYPASLVTDSQDPNPTVTCTPPSGSMFPIGSTAVSCTATDANGNTSTGAFNVIVSFIDEDEGDVEGEVPPTLNLTVTGSAVFDPFVPGLAQDYFTTLGATVTSSAAHAALTVADPSPIATGRMVNGAFSLAQPLQARATTAGFEGEYAAIGGSSAPTPLLSYAGPVSSDAVTIGLKQSIGSSDPLRTGTYSKTLTFTLSTTQP
jgi:X-Pro dipeptidyl-peptidase